MKLYLQTLKQKEIPFRILCLYANSENSSYKLSAFVVIVPQFFFHMEFILKLNKPQM